MTSSFFSRSLLFYFRRESHLGLLGAGCRMLSHRLWILRKYEDNLSGGPAMCYDFGRHHLAVHITRFHPFSNPFPETTQGPEPMH